MEAKVELYKALAAFQNEVPTIHKGTKGYGYSYADLPTIFNVINPLLSKHGLGVTQLLNSDDIGDSIKTIVFHSESGQTLESNTRIPKITMKGMNDYQSFGSGCTYYRRYAISNILRLVTDVDADATGTQVAPKPVKTEVKQLMTDSKFEKAKECNLDQINKVLSTFKFMKPQQRKELEEIRDNLNKK
jgi:hypothetical protein